MNEVHILTGGSSGSFKDHVSTIEREFVTICLLKGPRAMYHEECKRKIKTFRQPRKIHH